jgi:hypothetical protein
VSPLQLEQSLVDESGMHSTQMGVHNKSENGRSCVGRFVRYHPVTVTSKFNYSSGTSYFSALNQEVAKIK